MWVAAVASLANDLRQERVRPEKGVESANGKILWTRFKNRNQIFVLRFFSLFVYVCVELCMFVCGNLHYVDGAIVAVATDVDVATPTMNYFTLFLCRKFIQRDNDKKKSDKKIDKNLLKNNIKKDVQKI